MTLLAQTCRVKPADILLPDLCRQRFPSLAPVNTNIHIQVPQMIRDVQTLLKEEKLHPSIHETSLLTGQSAHLPLPGGGNITSAPCLQGYKMISPNIHECGNSPAHTVTLWGCHSWSHDLFPAHSHGDAVVPHQTHLCEYILSLFMLFYFACV